MITSQTKKGFVIALISLSFFPFAGCSSEISSASLQSNEYRTSFTSAEDAEKTVSTLLGDQVLRVGGTTRVDYTHLDKGRKSVFETYLGFFQKEPLKEMTKEEKTATLLNIYHCALLLRVKEVKDKDSTELPADFLTTQKIHILGVDKSLADLRTDILTSSEDVTLPFLIADGTVGGADFPLGLYTKDTLHSEGARAMKDFINHPRGVKVDSGNGNIKVAELFRDNEERFTRDYKSLTVFLEKNLEDARLKKILAKQNVRDFQNNRTINSL